MKKTNIKEKRIHPYWIDREDWNTYIRIKNKELAEKDKIKQSVADRFRIVHNLSGPVGIGGMASALFLPVILAFFFDSELAGKIFITWFGIVMFLVALGFFQQAYMGFRYNLTGTYRPNSISVNKDKKIYLFASVDEISAPLWSMLMLVLGIILIGVDILIYLVFYF